MQQQSSGKLRLLWVSRRIYGILVRKADQTRKKIAKSLALGRGFRAIPLGSCKANTQQVSARGVLFNHKKKIESQRHDPQYLNLLTISGIFVLFTGGRPVIVNDPYSLWHLPQVNQGIVKKWLFWFPWSKSGWFGTEMSWGWSKYAAFCRRLSHQEYIRTSTQLLVTWCHKLYPAWEVIVNNSAVLTVCHAIGSTCRWVGTRQKMLKYFKYFYAVLVHIGQTAFQLFFYLIQPRGWGWIGNRLLWFVKYLW